MNVQKFTYSKIVNIHGSQPLSGCVYVGGVHVWLKIFPIINSVERDGMYKSV
jgi:hypothetical protein